MIRLQQIKIHNFGSFAKNDYTFDLSNNGLTIIRGENGAGKTTMISAIVWCIYGRGLKKNGSIEPWEWLRGKNYDGTMVELILTKGGSEYKIVRCLDYKDKIEGSKGGNRTIIWKDDTVVPLKGVAEHKDYISKLIPLSYDLMVSSVIFGQKMKRLIEESGPKQKELLDEIFETSFIQAAREKTKKDLEDLNRVIGRDELSRRALDVEVSGLNSEIESLTLTSRFFDKEKKRKIKLIAQEIKDQEYDLEILRKDDIGDHFGDLQTSIEELKAKLEPGDIAEVGNLYNQTQERFFKFKADRDSTTKDYKKLKASLERAKTEDTCPYCGSLLDDESRDKHLKEIQADINHSLDALKALKGIVNRHKIKLSSVSKRLKKHNSLVKKIEVLEKEYSEALTLKKEIKMAEDNLMRLKRNRIEVESSKLGNIKPKISSLKKTRSIKQAELDEINFKITRLKRKSKLKEWLINDPLSNSGLKVFIFQSMISGLNKRLTHYAKHSGLRSKFEIDMSSHHKGLENYTYIGDHVVPYEDLSGGQGQIVNINIAFALHDIITKTVDFNILFLDEVFESLSKKSIEIVTDLIHEKAQKKSVWLVTHRDEFSTRNSEMLEFVLESGITTIKQ